MSQLRLRPPRHARAVPGMRYNSRQVKRLARILLNALTVLSLLFFMATVVFWVRSHRHRHTIWFRNEVLHENGYQYTVRTIESAGGKFVVARLQIDAMGQVSLPGERPNDGWRTLGPGDGGDWSIGPKRGFMHQEFAGPSSLQRSGQWSAWEGHDESLGLLWYDGGAKFFERRSNLPFAPPGDLIIYYAPWRSWHFVVPYWLSALLFGALPLRHVTMSVKRRVEERRRRAGLCRSCGYDLRATPERCPECGAVPAR